MIIVSLKLRLLSSTEVEYFGFERKKINDFLFGDENWQDMT